MTILKETILGVENALFISLYFFFNFKIFLISAFVFEWKKRVEKCSLENAFPFLFVHFYDSNKYGYKYSILMVLFAFIKIYIFSFHNSFSHLYSGVRGLIIDSTKLWNCFAFHQLLLPLFVLSIFFFCLNQSFL